MQARFTITPIGPAATSASTVVPGTFAYGFAGLAIAAIWISTVLASLWAPDLVSGSQQEHLPLVGLTAWLWGAIATGIVVLATLDGIRTPFPSRAAWVALGVGVSLVWLAVLLVSVFTPVIVTGTDPTQVPLASVGAGIVGVFVTLFVCLFVKATQTPQTPRIPPSGPIPAKLRELAALRDAGVITVQDFETTKADLLSRM